MVAWASGLGSQLLMEACIRRSARGDRPLNRLPGGIIILSTGLGNLKGLRSGPDYSGSIAAGRGTIFLESFGLPVFRLSLQGK